jgi:hypothetical protein
MRREFIAVAVGITALAGLSGCGHPPLSGASAQAAVSPSAAPDATAMDPYAFKDVPYQDYRQAAEQLSIPFGLLVPPAGFTEALSTLCRSTPDDFTKLVNDQRSRAGSDSDGASTLQSLADEVQLRLSLSCPQRMTDWAASRADDQANSDDVVDTASPTPSSPSSVSESGPSSGSDDPGATAGDTVGDGDEDATPAPTD